VEDPFVCTSRDRLAELRDLRVSYLQFVVLLNVSKGYLSWPGGAITKNKSELLNLRARDPMTRVLAMSGNALLQEQYRSQSSQKHRFQGQTGVMAQLEAPVARKQRVGATQATDSAARQ
jgi:hypothetical protein